MRFPRVPAIVMLSTSILLITSTAAFAAKPSATPTAGYDVSYPQCGSPLPSNPAFGIVGVSDGLAYGQNPCLTAEVAWAAKAPAAPALYMNTGNPGAASSRVNWYAQSNPRPCSPATEVDCAYDYGYNGAQQAFQYAVSQTSQALATTATWWLDVETANSWSADPALNVADLHGSIDFLAATVHSVGIYSTGSQWGQITGGAQFAGVADWVAGAVNANRAPALCSSSFSGGRVRLVQYPVGATDGDYACP